MPVYTVYHRSTLGPPDPGQLAKAFTDLHCTVTGAPSSAVKVIFISLDEHSFFSGGEKKKNYVRVVAQIRVGRTEEQRMSLLSGMFEIVQKAFRGSSEWEIQTQIVEIDDTNTVMTNGVLNT